MKSREIPKKIKLTAVQGHPRSSTIYGANQKRICNFLLAIKPTSNFGRIEILTSKARK